MTKMLCVSMTERTSRECVTFVKSCAADMIEHRLDFMDSIENLDSIYGSLDKPIIATCRSTRDGGYFRGGNSQRIGHLLKALYAGASYIDIELDTTPSLRGLVQMQVEETGSQLIVSKHFHDSTPSLIELVTTLNTMKTVGADIAKIVTTPNTIKDCITMLQLYNIEQDINLPLISFAMGDLGKFTRVCALFLGAPFMYVAPDSGAAAAPGQIPLSKMKAILEDLQ